MLQNLIITQRGKIEVEDEDVVRNYVLVYLRYSGKNI